MIYPTWKFKENKIEKEVKKIRCVRVYNLIFYTVYEASVHLNFPKHGLLKRMQSVDPRFDYIEYVELLPNEISYNNASDIRMVKNLLKSEVVKFTKKGII